MGITTRNQLKSSKNNRNSMSLNGNDSIDTSADLVPGINDISDSEEDYFLSSYEGAKKENNPDSITTTADNEQDSVDENGGGFILSNSDSDIPLYKRARKKSTKKRATSSKTNEKPKKSNENTKENSIVINDSDSDSLSSVPEFFDISSDNDLENNPAQKSESEYESAIEISDTDLINEPSNSRSARSNTESRSRSRPRSRTTAARKKPRRLSPLSQLYKQHPKLKNIFEELEKEQYKPHEEDQPTYLTTPLLPFQKEGLDWFKHQEKSKYKGGILADEMGMGKTIQMISLLAAEPRRKPNVVIAPTVALVQWKNEIEQHTGCQLSVYIYYGPNRENNIKKLMEHDVILTTYSVMESAYRKERTGFKRQGGVVKEKSVMHSIHFARIILDEAHNIKSRSANTTKAVIALKGDFRFCLSGTPLQNRIGELYSLLRFLKIDPFAMYFCRICDCKSMDWSFENNSKCRKCGHSPMQHSNWFIARLLRPIQQFGSVGVGKEAMESIHTLLGSIMLRRTKLERADDLGLPPRIVTIRRDRFSPQEKDFYSSIYSDSKRKFNTYASAGVVLNNYANIFSLITLMRQVADHPDLVLRKRANLDAGESNIFVCKICDDEAQEAIESRCHHVFCRACITEYVENSRPEYTFDIDSSNDNSEHSMEGVTCPVCHVPLVINLAAPAKEVNDEFLSKSSIVNRINMDEWHSSTKIEALLEELYRIRSDKYTIKSIVFSQFSNMLDLVEWRLNRAGFHTVKLQGNMSPMQRDQSIQYFMNNTHCEVFLVSLKAGGVALNLCEASHVFILDPWWNPSAEWQSGDRVHRIGQYRPVKITKLIIDDSIESKIVELQEKKANMIKATIGQDESAMSKLTQADMEFLFTN